MKRVARALAMSSALVLPAAAGCSAIDPKVGPSQQSCGADTEDAGGTGGTTGYGPAPAAGPGSSSVAGALQLCRPDAGSACDGCESAFCCDERTACGTDPVCACADRTLDACLASAGPGPSAPVSKCWDAFAERGTVERERVACMRVWCEAACVVP